MQRYPSAAGQMLIALDWYLGPTYEIAILGGAGEANTTRAIAELRKRFIPNKLVAFRPASVGSVPQGEHRSEALDGLFAGKESLDPPPTVYICENFACQAPIAGVADVLAAWQRL
jgi:uncharacterized protein YyaL (SSP411 family)